MVCDLKSGILFLTSSINKNPESFISEKSGILVPCRLSAWPENASAQDDGWKAPPRFLF
jgi:hypothetical protein